MRIARCCLRTIVGIAVLWGLTAGCGGADRNRRQGGAVLEKIGAEDAAQLRDAAPEAFEKAERYAALAESFAEKGEPSLEERYLSLAEHQLKLARMVVEKRRLEADIEKNERERKRVDAEIANVRVALENLAAEAERREIRRHLEAVVDDTRRRAAAEEAERERRYTGKDKTAIRQARVEVAVQMIARAKLWLDMLPLVMDAEENGTERLVPVAEAIAAAEADVDTGDLALVQENLERAGAAGRALLNDAWGGETDARQSRMTSAAKSLSDAGFQASIGEFGVVLPLISEASRSREALKKLSEHLDTLQSFGWLVVAVADTGDTSMDRSAALATSTATHLVDAGVPSDAIRSRGAGDSVPLKVLKEGGEAVALVLVPVPARQ